MRTHPVVPISTLAFLCLCLVSAPPLHAQRHLSDVLQKGSEWSMQVNGDSSTLKLLGGRGRQTSDGGFELKNEVAWGGAQGVLEGKSDAAGKLRKVSITLTLEGGAKTQCVGALALGRDDMMAGTCDGPTGTGAWYALRAGSEKNGSKQRGAKKPATVGSKSDSAVRDHRIQPVGEPLEIKTTPGVVAGTPCPPGQGGQPPPVSRIEGQATGVYGVGGKDDSVVKLDFPNIPGSDSPLGKWLNAHNDGLLSSLRLLYPSSDINQLVGAERSRCVNGGIFCQIGFRQQALAAALAGSR